MTDSVGFEAQGDQALAAPVAGAASFRSRDRESLIEHVFIAEVLQESWFVRKQPMEVLRSEVDAYGYDLVLESNGIIRHLQLKSSEETGKTRRQTINRNLETKVGGCVVWVVMNVDESRERIRLSYRYFGGRRPRDRMPLLGSVYGVNARTKRIRENTRVLDIKQFEEISTTAALLDRMFGRSRS